MSFSSEELRLSRLSAMGDPLVKVSRAIEWEFFRPLLNEIFCKPDPGVGGRAPWDRVLMFKILLLQSWYTISDDKTEYLINDRLSFQRFLGLSLEDKVPDAKTIWLFRDMLSKNGSYSALFYVFTEKMASIGVITREGSLIDATFVDVPRQRNTREENKDIKAGKTPDDWKNPENSDKLRQKDVDARWTRKNNELHYGYKNHVKIDRVSKMIVNFAITDAAVHDSREMVGLLDEKDRELHGDSAYVGKELHEEILEKYPDLKLKINEKGYRNRPLTEEQRVSNKEKSRIRARVEHVFGYMTNSMGGIFIRLIGIRRAKCAITMKNLAYNMSRYVYLTDSKKLKRHITKKRG
jgi:IS5 family transposase